MTGTSPPGDPARIGPWTLHTFVTASCSLCDAIPLDEDSGLTPHFDGATQARQELTRDWGWHLTARRDEEVLLCPACAAATSDSAQSRPPAADEDGERPDAAPWWQSPRQPSGELPVNAAVSQAQGKGEPDGSAGIPDPVGPGAGES